MYKKMGIVLVLLMFLMGCVGSKVQQNTLTAYESTGVTLESIHKTAESLCDSKMIKASDCNKMIVIYSQAKVAFRQVGDATIIVANASDSIQKQVQMCKDTNISNCDIKNLNLVYQSALAAYKKVSDDAIKLLNEFIKFAGQVGILKGGK